ncbi:glycosyltransferase family 2 protein [Amycolatopsis rhabdoformis]|uniref:Glycosyltransferase family 2 protein n=1 Tax=Amycolatopsis rhabdoformis TaxID=1448059 RepID=A0ABZ1I9G7_9PSEU|nr:glycosyltransferase family 2 protein [Amycolatopsis rhabdoformis]WSE30557.1 glycosyltransferase family 2 protein [Amycolatopsis rhabdoformis]
MSAPTLAEPRPGRHRSGGVRVVALIPAHDEEAQIAATIAGLRAQERPVDEIVVVTDNCADDTAAVALAAGAKVRASVGNRHKKAGALNQALAWLLPRLDEDDVILVQDADSTLDPQFVRVALGHVERGYGGVGGVFRGGPGGGFVGHLQRNEYARYARDVHRLRGKCLVLTGTAAMFRVGTLREVSAARLAGPLPAGDGAGGIYDTTVLTEDNELTFALLHLGHRVISPAACTLETEVMTTWRELWLQHLRWKRGAVENCVQYGLTRITWRYWGRQLLTLAGVLVSLAYLATIVVALGHGGLHLQPLWLGISGIFVVERVVTVRYRGWRRMLLAASMYELVLDYFLQACHAKAYADALLRTRKSW